MFDYLIYYIFFQLAQYSKHDKDTLRPGFLRQEFQILYLQIGTIQWEASILVGGKNLLPGGRFQTSKNDEQI